MQELLGEAWMSSHVAVAVAVADDGAVVAVAVGTAAGGDIGGVTVARVPAVGRIAAVRIVDFAVVATVDAVVPHAEAVLEHTAERAAENTEGSTSRVVIWD
jgi:hypothetical protein